MCEKVQNGGGGGRYQRARGRWLCALSGWRRVAQCNGQEPRQPSSKVNSTARLPSPVWCLFCRPWSPPDKCWQTAAWPGAHTFQRGLQAPYLCAGSAAALNCCHVPSWVGAAALASRENPTGVAGVQSACSLSMHAAAGSCAADCFQRACFPLPDSQ